MKKEWRTAGGAVRRTIAGLCVWACLAAGASMAQEPSRDVRFQWAIMKRSADGGRQFIPAKRPLTLATGDSLKLYVRPETNLCLYILLMDSSDALYAVFPPGGEPAKALAAGTETVIPPGDQWFELDQAPGVETFHVVASPSPLPSLEAQCRRLRGLGQPQDAQAQKAVLAELRVLSQKHSRLAAMAEKPISIAGTMRSADPSAPPEINQVSASGFASKIIHVEHK